MTRIGILLRVRVKSICRGCRAREIATTRRKRTGCPNRKLANDLVTESESNTKNPLCDTLQDIDLGALISSPEFQFVAP